MKKVLILISILSLIACKEKPKESIVGIQFQDYTQLNQFKDFKKVSDTSFIYNETVEFGLTHLKNEKKDLVIFSSIENNSKNTRNYKVLDTLEIYNLNGQERLTIGYCDFDLKNQNQGNLIALIENVNYKNMFISKIKSVWTANPNSKKIEKLKNIGKIDCFNEWYNGEESKINFDLLNEKA